MRRYLTLKVKKLWLVTLAVVFFQVIMLNSSYAALLAVGDRGSYSYQLGVAISSILTLKQENQTVYFDVIPSGGDSEELKLLKDKVSDFALVSSASADGGGGEEGAEAIRGLTVVRYPQDEHLLLITRSDVAEQDVVDVIQTIFDNLDTLFRLHDPAEGIHPYTEARDRPFPIHPGAARYFAETDQEPISAAAIADDDQTASERLSVIADLSAKLDLVEQERETLADEIESGRLQRKSIVEELEGVTQKLQAVTSERERLFDELTVAKRQIDSIEFRNLSEANETAKAMRVKAEETEARYQEAFGLVQTCLEAQSGKKDSALEALVQIERLEAELTACRGRDGEAN